MRISEELQEKAVAEELSQRFKQFRIAYPMTREELSEKSMVSVGTISRFENGKDIGLLNFLKLLKAVGLEEKVDLLLPDPTERPSYYISSSPVKQRARKRKKEDNSWKWGDEV